MSRLLCGVVLVNRALTSLMEESPRQGAAEPVPKPEPMPCIRVEERGVRPAAAKKSEKVGRTVVAAQPRSAVMWHVTVDGGIWGCCAHFLSVTNSLSTGSAQPAGLEWVDKHRKGD